MAYDVITDVNVPEKTIPAHTTRASYRKVLESTFNVDDTFKLDATGLKNSSPYAKNLCEHIVVDPPSAGNVMRCVITVDFQEISAPPEE